MTRDDSRVKTCEAVVVGRAVAFAEALDAYDRILHGEHDGPYLNTLGDTQDALRDAVRALKAAEAAS